MPFHISVPPDASAADLAIVDRGLGAWNAAEPALADVRALAVIAKDDAGSVAGGAVGRTWGTCCELQHLWVHESARRRGLGSALVRRFEDEARRRGCRLVYLDTFSFQAPSFYAAHGYRTALETDGYTRGVVRHTMRKTLAGEPGAAARPDVAFGGNASSRIRATYRVRAAAAEIEALARNLALEQSVEVAADVVRDAFVAREVMGRVGDVRDRRDGTFDVDLLLASATTGGDPAQLLNMLFGNSSLHAHVELAGVELPDDLAARFPGPRFGIAGWRDALRVHGRALTCAALKPQGLPVDRLAALCGTLAASGVDVVKDDHGLADQAYSPFAQRVAACERAVREANRATGRQAIYAPSLVGSPAALARCARIVHDEGVRAVLVAPALVGMPAFAELVAELRVPVLAHPAYAGAARVAPALLLGRLFRLLGADATIFPNWGGRFAYGRETCVAIGAAAREPWHGFAPVLPVPAGGLAVERVPELLDVYGRDAMLLIGGSLLMAGDDLGGRARTFVDAVARHATAATDR